MELIDKAAVVAIIERLTDNVCDRLLTEASEGAIVLSDEILSSLDTLEVKEVDLEKEIKEVQYKYKTIEEYKGYPCTMYANDIEWIAKHFFKFGLKAQKGE